MSEQDLKGFFKSWREAMKQKSQADFCIILQEAICKENLSHLVKLLQLIPEREEKEEDYMDELDQAYALAWMQDDADCMEAILNLSERLRNWKFTLNEGKEALRGEQYHLFCLVHERGMDITDPELLDYYFEYAEGKGVFAIRIFEYILEHNPDMMTKRGEYVLDQVLELNEPELVSSTLPYIQDIDLSEEIIEKIRIWIVNNKGTDHVFDQLVEHQINFLPDNEHVLGHFIETLCLFGRFSLLTLDRIPNLDRLIYQVGKNIMSIAYYEADIAPILYLYEEHEIDFSILVGKISENISNLSYQELKPLAEAMEAEGYVIWKGRVVHQRAVKQQHVIDPPVTQTGLKLVPGSA